MLGESKKKVKQCCINEQLNQGSQGIFYEHLPDLLHQRTAVIKSEIFTQHLFDARHGLGRECEDVQNMDAWWTVERKQWTIQGFGNAIGDISIQCLNTKGKKRENSLVEK